MDGDADGSFVFQPQNSSMFRRLAIATAGTALVLVACGGGSTDSDSADPSTTVAADDLAFASSTTIAVIMPPVETNSGPDDSTTMGEIEDLGPIAPLTGAPVAADADLAHPALVIKIDNHLLARPQVGLEAADLVFDIRAEGVTRFMAVFHSQLPETIGPVRSSRTSDFDLLRGLDNPLYASSGGNVGVMAGLSSLPIHELTNNTRTEYYRHPARPAPHNLFIDPADLFALVSSDVAPDPWFGYRQAGAALPSEAVVADGIVTIDFTGSPTVTFEWSRELAGWLRSQDGRPHRTADGYQLAPENVVIMITTYGSSAADARSPEVRSTGSGTLIVLTEGHIVTGSWSRAAATDKAVLLDEEGSEIALTPGQTWVLYPEAGQVRY